MRTVHVAGVGMTAFGRHPDSDVYALIEQAVQRALLDAGAGLDQVQWAAYGTVTHGWLHGQICVPGPIAMRRLGLQRIPVFTVENACASGSSAFHLAWQALQAGACDIALAVGADKMVVPDKARAFAVFEAGWDVQTAQANQARLIELGHGIEPPPGTMSTKPYSVFMDVYAAFCRDHMRRHGTTQRQIAAVAAKNHTHSVHNPLSQYRQAYTVEEVLAAPPIAYPLTLPMCAPVSDGAAAALLCTDAGLQRLAGNARRAVRVRASVVQVGEARTADAPQRSIAALAARRAYEQAGLGPQDVHLAEVHDATAMGELLNVEALGLVPLGQSGPAVERGELSIGGRLPVNPSGGLESKGHPIGATGLGQVHELVLQLRGEAGPRQVDGARLAIQENGGGLIGIEEAVAAVQIFERAAIH
jgi:acetyl-CoA acetyltransferase